jgi:hypothetical protein
MVDIVTRDFANGGRGGGVLIYGINVIDGKTYKICDVDASGSLIHISHQHSKVHQGDYYNCSHYYSAVADNGTAELLIKLSANYENHAVIQIGTGGDGRLDLYENPTLSDNGTSINVINHNRSKALASPTRASSSTAFHTPTHNSPQAYGTPLIPGFVLPGGTKDKGGGAIAEASGEQWVWAASNDYLVKVTNQSGSAQDISIDVAFYEVAV